MRKATLLCLLAALLMMGFGLGRGAAAILVREAATARQIWITAVGTPMMVTVLIRFQPGRKERRCSLMTDRPLR